MKNHLNHVLILLRLTYTSFMQIFVSHSLFENVESIFHYTTSISSILWYPKTAIKVSFIPVSVLHTSMQSVP